MNRLVDLKCAQRLVSSAARFAISLLVLIASVDREIRRETRERFQHACQGSPHRVNYQFVTLTLDLDL